MSFAALYEVYPKNSCRAYEVRLKESSTAGRGRRDRPVQSKTSSVMGRERRDRPVYSKNVVCSG